MTTASDLRLELFDGTNTYTFAYDGRLTIRQNPEYNESAEPVQLRQITERWSVRGARIVSPDQASTLAAWQNFLAQLEDRNTTPLTGARIVRDPTGTAQVVRTLSSSTYEAFRLEEVEFGDEVESALEAAEWNVVVPVSFAVSAFRVFPDGNGIVAWDQTVRHRSGPDALQVVEWETALSTAEGAATTALAQAQSNAVIPIADYGNTYVWDTNSENGFDYEELDPNTLDSRTATRLRIVSRIKQVGITIGTPAAGNSVSDPSYSVTEETTGNITRTITEASAIGPGALAWVNSKQPDGRIAQSSVYEDQAKRIARGRWTQEDPTGTSAGGGIPGKPVRYEVSATLSGGKLSEEFVTISGDYPPLLALGPRKPWRLDVSVSAKLVGVRPDRSSMKFPPLLPSADWRLRNDLSREDPYPRRISVGADEGSDTWERSATLVYVSNKKDAPVDEVAKLFDDDKQNSVLSYLE